MAGNKEKGGGIELSEFTCKPCRGRAGFEFLPKEKGRGGGKGIDLLSSAGKLRAAGAEIEAESRYLVIMKLHGAKITLFRSGKMIVKGLKEEQKAREVAEEIAKLL